MALAQPSPELMLTHFINQLHIQDLDDWEIKEISEICTDSFSSKKDQIKTFNRISKRIYDEIKKFDYKCLKIAIEFVPENVSWVIKGIFYIRKIAESEIENE